MNVIHFGSKEFAQAPERMLHIMAVINDVQSWSKAIFALKIGGTVELRAEDAASAVVREGEFIDPLFEVARSSLERDPFMFIVEMKGDKTTLRAERAHYNSYQRFITFQLWERDQPDLKIEFSNLSFFTTDPPN